MLYNVDPITNFSLIPSVLFSRILLRTFQVSYEYILYIRTENKNIIKYFGFATFYIATELSLNAPEANAEPEGSTMTYGFSNPEFETRERRESFQS